MHAVGRKGGWKWHNLGDPTYCTYPIIFDRCVSTICNGSRYGLLFSSCETTNLADILLAERHNLFLGKLVRAS